MNYRIINSEKLALILSTTRTQAKKSQKYMAQALGKSIGTIQNWEAGIGSPNLLDTLEWFHILDTNALGYILDLIYPNPNSRIISAQCSDEEIREALILYLKEVAGIDEIRKLSYSIFGQTGSVWSCQLDMLTAHNHTSLKSRLLAAQFIVNSYEMEKARGELICTDDIMPDEEKLRTAILNCKNSVSEGKSRYTI